MTEPSFSERRTRSQLTLPDTILNTLERSPLKEAKTRNHIAANDAQSTIVSDSEEDELLLSPGKKEAWMEPTTAAKRSASPPPQGGYMTGPSDGRMLKRVKRDILPESDIEITNTARASGHTRTHSDPNVPTGRRSTRKRLATASKKPISTVSASPTSTTFSPSPTSPITKGRAQSVPLFSTAQDMPRIDFRNPPPSPKRKRSRSRSPSKDRELKLRITLTNVVIPPKLPTILAGVATGISTSDDESSVPEEMEMPPIPNTSSTSPTTTSQPILPTAPATPGTYSLNKLIPMSPLTPVPETPFPARTNPTTDAQERYGDESGWDIEPMKDLASGSHTSKPPTAIAPSTSLSRLPRLSMAPPPLPPSKLAHPVTQRFSTLASKKPIATSQHIAGPIVARNTVVTASAPTRDAFDMLMQGSHKAKAQRDKEKGKGKTTMEKPRKPVIAGTFAPVITKGKTAGPAESSTEPKVKIRDNMRKKEKLQAPKKVPVIAPLPDDDEEEEEEEERRELQSTETPTATIAEEAIVQPSQLPLPASATASPEPPVNGPMVTEDAVMTDEIHDPAQVDDKVDGEASMAMADVEIPVAQAKEQPAPDYLPQASADIVPETLSNISAEGPTSVMVEPAPELVSDTVGGGSTNEAQELAQDVSDFLMPAASEQPVEEEEMLRTDPRPSPRASKIPFGKKRQPMSVAPPSRVTRSVSNSQRNTGEPDAPQQAPKAAPSHKKAGPAANIAKRTTSRTLKKPAAPTPAPSVKTTLTTDDVSMDVAEDKEERLPPGSPMKLTSPSKAPPKASSSPTKQDEAKTMQYGAGTLSLARTPTKSRLSFGKPASSPSPSKIARSSTLLSLRPPAPGITRAFSSSQLQSGPGSSLTTLSNALEKLRMPPPARPSTSMGFNRDSASDIETLRTKDDVTIGRVSLGLGQTDGAVKRSTTLGPGSFKSTTTTTTTADNTASSSKNLTSATSSGDGKLVQKHISMFMSTKVAGAKGKGPVIRGPPKMGTQVIGHRPIFGVGGGPRRTISKKSSLPVVIGSPVKGGGNAEETMQEANEDEIEEDEDAGGKIFNAIVNGSSATLLLENLLAQAPEKGKGKEKERDAIHKASSHSRRVSMLSRDLSQSLNANPPPNPHPPARGLMGPPATPPSTGGLSARSLSDNGSPSAGSSSGATRSSARLAKIAPAAPNKIKGSSAGHVSSGPAPNPAVEALQILNDCVIFVDVKTDDGDEAGTLFVEMLEGVGARVLTRVGQTCTHIVFKNGLTSTTTRYRHLRDPKPFVVGIGWVVECVEQRKRVDETEFLVDLEYTNIIGANKRRRSILPKLFANESSMAAEAEKDDDGDGDRSMDGSVSSVTMDDGLAPLERARRRKSMMTGLHP